MLSVRSTSATASKAAQRTSQRAIQCSAVPEHAAARRAILFGAVLPAIISGPAKALIPDEEDEELVEKAKANRSKRLAEQRATTRAFMSEEGLTNKSLSKDLIPVQKAVYKLAQSGSQLESGDVKAADSTLGESWVAEFTSAAAKVSTTNPETVVTALTSLKAATGSGDLTASKKQYVALVDAVQAWATASGLAGALKGL